MDKYDKWFLTWLERPLNPIGAAAAALVLFLAVLYWEQTRFMLKSLRRNLLRTVLTGLAMAVLVMVVTLVWSVLAFIDRQTEAKSANFKAVVTERYGAPSQLPDSYAGSLSDGAPHKPGDHVVNAERDSMTWGFFIGTVEPGKRSFNTFAFFLCMEPRKLMSEDDKGGFQTMMDDADQFSDDDKRKLVAACAVMERDPTKVLMGVERLKVLNKKVGDRIKVYGINYKDIDLEVEIIGALPQGRYEQFGVMNYRYLRNSLDQYKSRNGGKAHQLDDKSLALVWVRVADTKTFEKVARQIETSPDYSSPAVKCETASSGMATWLDGYRGLLWGARWLLVPTILFTMSLVISNAISISVRERRVEMAVLKVLGFTPGRILVLVLGEALLIGCGSGVLSAVLTRVVVNVFLGGIPFPIGFFGKIFVASEAPWWGLAIGGATALAGSIVPAWSARSIKVSEVFSKIS